MKVNMNGSLSRAARMMLGFAALLGAAIPAFAAGNTINLGSSNVWTVYAFGNASAVADAFRALTNFAASGMFQSLVSMIAVIGVIGVGASGGFNPGQAKKLIGYCVSVFLVCYFLFGVTNGGPLVVNVEVIDTVDMTWKAPVTVPAVVGIPAAIISSAGYKLTQSIEASFALPTALKMSNGAPFNLAASMIADASQARITDPNLSASLSYYVQDCFTIGVARGVLRADTLIRSTNFLEDIKFDSASVMVNTLLQDPGVGTPGIVSCSEAWGLISKAVNAQGSTASDFLKDASAWTKTPAMSVVNAAADSTAQWASNGGMTDGASLVKQSAVLSAFRGAYAQAANQTGNSEFLTGIAMTQATESQRTSWITGAEVFNKTMGYIFAIIQVFVYAITPLVLSAALVPSLGLALLKNFSQILLWLAIWQPMLSIVNFIIISMQQAELGGILSSGSAYGFTLSNVGIVSEKTANLRAAASFVGTMVPALAWAMVKGSVDFSRVIGSAVGENFAQGAANTMTTGNYSLNQASMDSFTANKNSIAASGAQGNGFSTNGATGSKENNLGGSDMMQAEGSRAAINVSSNQGTTEGATSSHMAGGGITGGNTTTASNGTSTGTTASGATTSGGQNSSGVNNTNTFTATGTGNVDLVKAGNGSQGDRASAAGGAPGAAGGAPGAAGTNGQPPGNTAPNVEPRKNVLQRVGDAVAGAADRVGIKVSGSGAAAVSGSRGHTDTSGHNNAVTTTGGTSASGSTTLTGGQQGSVNDSAGTTSGAQKGDSEVVTGIPSSFAKAQMMATYMRPNNSMTQGKWSMPTAVKSDVGDKVERLKEHNAVGDQVAAREKTVDKQETKLEHDAEHLRDEAKAKKRKNDDEAKAAFAHEKAATAAGVPASKVDANTRAMGALAENGKDAVAAAGSMYEKAKEAMGLSKPEEKPSDKPGAAGTQAGQNVKPQDGSTAKQPDSQGGKPQEALQAKQPDEHGKKPQEAQQVKQQDTRNAKQPDDHGKKPDDHGKKPQETQQVKQDGQGGKHQDTQHAKQPDDHGKKPQETQQVKQDGQGGKHQDTQHAKQPDDHGKKPQETQQVKQDGQGGKHQDTQHAKQPDDHGKKPQETQQVKQQDGQGGKPQEAGKAAANAKPADGQAVAATQLQPQGGQPVPQPAAGNGKGGASDKPQQLASQTGKEQDRDLQKPDQQKPDDRALAQADQQRQQEQRQRELQERQLAAAGAVGQALQTAQAAPQPQVQQPGANPLQDGNAAGANQQQMAMNGDSAAPNPFSGEKAATSEGQLHGQVQMAEQRSERMNNQLRGVETALASAEDRKPGELSQLITEARDMMRNV
jgi:hypothetical protein